jgi:hypothetical protein
MKTSNKILLALFVISLFFTAAIPVAVNYSYSRKHFYNVQNGESARMETHTFKPVQFISLKDVKNCLVVPSDSLRLDIDNSIADNTQFRMEGDTFLLQQNLQPKQDSGSKSNITLYLPIIKRMKLLNSEIQLKGSFNPRARALQGRSYEIDLINSQLASVKISEDRRLTEFFNEISITGKGNSSVDLNTSLRITKLALVNVNHITLAQWGLHISELSVMLSPTTKVQIHNSNRDNSETEIISENQ